MKDYPKYRKQGDLHWQWYAVPKHLYRQIVDISLEPFVEYFLGCHPDQHPTLVDVGCGDGLPLSKLVELGYVCTGVEPMREGIEQAKNHKVKAEFFNETAEQFNERKRAFDFLYCLNTIEHLEHPECIVDMMRRVKRFGVLITDNKHIAIKPSAWHVQEFEPSDIEKMFAEFNLRPLEMRTPEYFGYVITKK